MTCTIMDKFTYAIRMRYVTKLLLWVLDTSAGPSQRSFQLCSLGWARSYWCSVALMKDIQDLEREREMEESYWTELHGPLCKWSAFWVLITACNNNTTTIPRSWSTEITCRCTCLTLDLAAEDSEKKVLHFWIAWCLVPSSGLLTAFRNHDSALYGSWSQHWWSQ